MDNYVSWQNFVVSPDLHDYVQTMLHFRGRSYSTRSTLAVFICVWLTFFTTRTYAQLPSKAQKIDQYIQARLTKSNVPGLAIAVVHNDSLLFSKGYGTTGAKNPITADTPLAIASLSKAFTAMAVMQLVEAGKINVDTPVVTYIPSFMVADPRGSAITIRQLLHQTSGLADTGFPELAFYEQPATLDEAISRLKSARLMSNPGEQFHYHNPNYQILAKMVEAVSHETFSDYLKQHIFQPLTMTHTRDVLLTKSFYSGPERLSNGHIYVLGKPIAFQEPGWFIDGAAGISSSVNDMAHWLTLQLNHGRFGNTQLLDSTSMAMTHSAPPGTSQHYGMGWVLTPNNNLYHSGILWTYSAEQLIMTKEGYGIVILFNGGLNPFVDYYSFIQGIADILDNQEPDMPVIPDWFYSVCIILALFLAIGFAIRRLFRARQWYQTYQQRPAWRSWLYLVIRFLPIIIFLLIPYFITLLSGRVLNWERIFLMMPDVILGLGIIALLNLMIAGTRFIRFFEKHG